MATGKDGTIADELSGLPDELQSILWNGGWRRSLHVDGAIDLEEDAVALVKGLLPLGMEEQAKEWGDALFLWCEARRTQSTSKRRRATNLTLEERVLIKLRKSTEQMAAAQAQVLTSIERFCTVTHWRTSRVRKLSEAASIDERASVERAERERWLLRLIQIVREARLPVVAKAESSLDPQSALLHIAGARRSKTIRMRVRCWSKLATWLQLTQGNSYPRSVGQLLDYLKDVVDGGCCRTIPDSIAAALAFVEQAGDVPLADRFSQDVLWLRTLQSVKADLVRGNTQVSKAPQFTISMVLALELLVMDKHKPMYVRALAWLRLVKLWCSLRFSDTLGMLPERMQLTQGGLKVTLVLTKTTGADKKIWELNAYLALGIGFTGYPWLEVGYTIWFSEAFCFPRDYFLPLPNKDLSATVRKMADYSAAAAMGRKLLSELRVPVKQTTGHWRSSDKRLIVEHGETFFTEHSERHFLVSVLAVLNVDSTKRDVVGRWGLNAERSDTYVLTGKHVVHEAQRQVCEKISSGSRYDEWELLDAYEAHLTLHLGKEEARDARDRLTLLHSTGAGGCFGLGLLWPMDPYALAFMDEPIPKEDFAETLHELPADDGAVEFDQEELEVVQAQVPPKPHPFWISIASKSGFQRLHRTGGCWVKPETCSDWKPIYRLQESVADASCKMCWPPSELAAAGSSSGSSGAESSSSEALTDHQDLPVRSPASLVGSVC